MEKNYQEIPDLFYHLPEAYAYHQAVTNDYGTPIDYIFLQVNPAFEAMTGLKAEAILGKGVTQVMPAITTGDFDWISALGQVGLTGEKAQFQQYSKPLNRWYTVTAYSDQPGYFTVLFYDITRQHREKENPKTILNSSNQFTETEDNMNIQQLNALLQEKAAMVQGITGDKKTPEKKEETPEDTLAKMINDTGLDKATAATLLEEGIQSCLEASSKTLEALEEKDFLKAKEQLHSLKGIASYLRMTTIAEWAAEGEVLVEADDFEELQALLQKTYDVLAAWEKKEKSKRKEENG